MSGALRGIVQRDLKPLNLLVPRPAGLFWGRRHRVLPSSRSLKRLLDSSNVCVRRRRAQLILDIHELVRESGSGVVSYGAWATVRGHQNLDAIRQDLHRMRALLSRFGAQLSFASPTVDLRDSRLQALVRRELAAAANEIDGRKEGDIQGEVSRETDTNHSGTCLHCGAVSRIPVEEIVTLRSSALFVSTTELKRRLHVGHPRLKRLLKREGLERPRGRQPIETLRSSDELAQASEVALARRRRFKVRVIEIAALLACSHRTAARFIRRAQARRKLGR